MNRIFVASRVRSLDGDQESGTNSTGAELLTAAGAEILIYKKRRRTEPLRLSLSQRERIKARDFFPVARRARTRLLVEFRPGSPGCRCCSISGRECLGAQENDRALDHVLAGKSTCGLRHRARSQVGPQGNKNPGCKYQLDVDGEIFNRRNFGSANCAKEYARRAWHFCADGGRGSLRRIIRNSARWVEAESRLQSALSPPHLNPLPRFGGEANKFAHRHTIDAMCAAGAPWKLL
jgi:hypothetical protein